MRKDLAPATFTETRFAWIVYLELCHDVPSSVIAPAVPNEAGDCERRDPRFIHEDTFVERTLQLSLAVKLQPVLAEFVSDAFPLIRQCRLLVRPTAEGGFLHS